VRQKLFFTLLSSVAPPFSLTLPTIFRPYFGCDLVSLLVIPFFFCFFLFPDLHVIYVLSFFSFSGTAIPASPTFLPADAFFSYIPHCALWFFSTSPERLLVDPSFVTSFVTQDTPKAIFFFFLVRALFPQGNFPFAFPFPLIFFSFLSSSVVCCFSRSPCFSIFCFFFLSGVPTPSPTRTQNSCCPKNFKRLVQSVIGPRNNVCFMYRCPRLGFLFVLVHGKSMRFYKLMPNVPLPALPSNLPK